MAADRAASADRRAWQGTGGRSASDQRYSARVEERLSVEGLPAQAPDSDPGGSCRWLFAQDGLGRMTDIARWLDGLGLGKYAAAFADAEIDLAAVPHLTDDDLKQLHLPLGPRRKVLAAAATAVTNSSPLSPDPSIPPTSLR